jgi:hypothetical protein
MSHDGKQKRRGSKNRQRTKRRTIRFSDDENAAIEKLIEATRSLQVPSSVMPRHPQPAISHETMVACLATTPKFANATLTGLNSGSPDRPRPHHEHRRKRP